MRPSVKPLFLIFVTVCFVIIVFAVLTADNLEVLGAWSYNRSRNVSVYVGPQEDTTIHLPNRFCSNEIFLLAIIYSTPGSFATRQVIRDTWASRKQVLNRVVDFYFFIGRANDLAVQGLLEEEYLKYDDIVQEDFVENYYNLTVKSVFMLKNVERRCFGKTEYLLKIDDDMYLNIHNLVNELSVSDRNNLIIGHLFEHVRPIRIPRSKWYAPRYLFEEDHYPPFVSGTGYVMSIDMVQKLYNASFSRPLYHLEDVYVTGILSRDIGVRPRDHPYFAQDKVYFSPCVYISQITSHGYTDEQISWLYEKTTKSNLEELCAQRCRYPIFTNCFV